MRATCKALARALGVEPVVHRQRSRRRAAEQRRAGAGRSSARRGRCRTAARLDRRLGRARRREPRQAHALRVARRQYWTAVAMTEAILRSALERRYRAATHELDCAHAAWSFPAHPLALDDNGRLDERRQRALTRYYVDAGAGGLAVGVHTTQFAIRDPARRPVRAGAALAREEMDRADARRRRRRWFASAASAARPHRPCARPTCWRGSATTPGCSAWPRLRDANDDDAHRALRGGRRAHAARRLLPAARRSAAACCRYAFWRRFAEIDNVVAIKIAPFNRYQTLDVVRAVADAGRDDIALYTGNDDDIVRDLLTPFPLRARRTASRAPDRRRPARPLGGVDARRGRAAATTATRRARRRGRCRRRCSRSASRSPTPTPRSSTPRTVRRLHRRASTRCCAARACSRARWCLDPHETLSPGQAAEIDRVCRAYPHLADDGSWRSIWSEWTDMLENVRPAVCSSLVLADRCFVRASWRAQDRRAPADLVAARRQVADRRRRSSARPRRWPSATADSSRSDRTRTSARHIGPARRASSTGVDAP